MSALPDALAVAHNGRVNGLNGDITPSDSIDNGALSSAPDSPAVPSPMEIAASPPVKIELDYLQRESDARHEPINISIDKLDDASTRPQLATPADPGEAQFSTCQRVVCLTNVLVDQLPYPSRRRRELRLHRLVSCWRMY